MKQQKVYSIVVTYNGMQWIKRCLNSLVNSSYNTHIIVIDNGSKDDTVSFIKKKYASVQLIETGKNIGFGQGNNIGLRIAVQNNADYVFLLNQDAWIEQDTISKLIKIQTENTAFGILSPIHLNGAETDLDGNFYNYFIQSDIREWIASAVLKKEASQPILTTNFVNAAAWLISGNCLRTTGGFDPLFFHYGEDDNYAQRVLFKGFKIGIATIVKIYHDRVQPSVVQSINVKIKKDWLNLLNLACDIRRPDYLQLILCRFLRHSFLTLLGIITFKTDKVVYNFSMAKRLGFSFFKIKESRSVSINSIMPYL